MDLQLLDAYSYLGAEEVAKILDRPVLSVKKKATEYSISLKRRWFCPSCGEWVYQEPSPRTGWCVACTKLNRRMELERELGQMRREVSRIEEEDRKRNALYVQKARLKKKLEGYGSDEKGNGSEPRQE